MLVLEVELLHGSIRAGTADSAITGQEDPGEWPPSPARLFSALVAADGTRDRMRVSDGSGLRALEEALPPLIECDPPAGDDLSGVIPIPALPRYVVVDRTMKNTVQNYPARQATERRSSTKLVPRSRLLRYAWPDLELDDQELRDLRARAARIPYLGCSDSPVRVRVKQVAEIELDSERTWNPVLSGDYVVGVPGPGLLDALDDQYDAFAAGGVPRRSAVWTPQSFYSAPTHQSTTRPEPPTMWLRFDRSVAPHRVLAVTETLRSAVLDRYPDPVPTVLHGHGSMTDTWSQARYLALPNVGSARSDGRIFGAAIALPADTGPEVVGKLRAVLSGITELVAPNVFRRAMSFHPGHGAPVSSAPRTWRGPATRWISATPAIYERFVKKGLTQDEVVSWCRNAGLPEIASARWAEAPGLPGAARLHRSQVHRDPRDRHPFVHLDIEFVEPVAGPVSVGRGRHFGLGLMYPVIEREAKDG